MDNNKLLVTNTKPNGQWSQREKEQFIEALCLTNKSNIKFIQSYI